MNNKILNYKYLLFDSLHRKGEQVRFVVPFSRFKIILNQYTSLNLVPGRTIDLERLKQYIIKDDRGNVYTIVKGCTEEEEPLHKCAVCDNVRTGAFFKEIFKCYACQIVQSDLYLLNLDEYKRKNKIK